MPRRHEFTPDEESLLLQLARRQHEQEGAESRLVERMGSRWALARQLYGFVAAIICGSYFATSYIVDTRRDVERNTREIQRLRDDTSRNSDRIETLRLEMKDKQNRKTDSQ